MFRHRRHEQPSFPQAPHGIRNGAPTQLSKPLYGFAALCVHLVVAGLCILQL